MEFLSDLWLPILVSGVFVWIASFLLWMVLPLHKGEYRKLPDEKGFMGALTEMGVRSGQFIFPCVEDPAQMKDPEFQALQKQGPNGYMVVWGEPVNMGRNMFLSLVVYWLLSVFVAYLAWHALEATDPYLTKFRIVGTAAVLGYVFGSLPHDIWFGKSGKSVATGIFDGVVYGLITAGTFGWLWKAPG
jgi:hypothetical protein